MKCASYNLFFDTFSNKTRMRIIESLMESPKPVGEICRALKEEQSKVSHSLKKLTECHFLEVQRKGKQRIYSLNKDSIVPILKMVENHVHKYCGEKCQKQ